MPQIALSALRPDFAKYLGLFESVETTTNITTTKLIVSTELPDLSYSNDDMLNGAWVFIEGVNNDRVSRYIDAYTGSTGTITVRGTNLVAETGDKTVEIYPYNPAYLLTLLNQVRIDHFGEFALPRRYTIPTLRGLQRTFPLPDGLFIGSPTEIRLRRMSLAGEHARNLLSEAVADFETGWTAAEAIIAFSVFEGEGNYSIPLREGGSVGHGATSGGSIAATVLNTLDDTDNLLAGVDIGFELWAYCVTADRLKARVDEDGSTSDGNAHHGLGWELLRAARKVTSDPTALKVGVVDITNAAAMRFYLARAFATQGPIEIAEERCYYDAPPWDYVPPYGTDTNGFIRFHAPMPADMALEIRGKDYLSSLSAEADTVEVDDQKAQLLIALAAERLAAERIGAGDEGSRFVNWRELLNRAQSDIETLRRNFRRRAEDIQPMYVSLYRGF